MAVEICGADTDEIKDILKIRLSKKRYSHSLNVADAALKLADKFGGDREKCFLAGLIHDICKEIPTEEQLKMGKSCIVPLSAVEEKIPALYHAAAGSWYCEHVLHIADEDILMAVRFHTAARAGMSLTEEIIYLADLISDDRSYKDVGKMRKLAFDDLKKAMLEALCFSVSDVISKGSLIPESTSQAYNYYAELFR
ncbi:MAG: bis(5'-nucleosyl)-tetraphosphatase (symmetrical) YqeK [Oscillospiraceae bacterium]|nr:bis(5'-nucleosyl)-tetraphosphatase (symmetrical) YqeK [Oscillospiraceae bacterium]